MAKPLTPADDRRGADDPRVVHFAETVLEFGTASPDAVPPLVVDLRLRVRPEVAARLGELVLVPFVVITACAPWPAPDDGLDDRSRDASLRQRLAALGAPSIPALGRSPDGHHREPGHAVAMELAPALALAREFRQTAIFAFDGVRFRIEFTDRSRPALTLPIEAIEAASSTSAVSHRDTEARREQGNYESRESRESC